MADKDEQTPQLDPNKLINEFVVGTRNALASISGINVVIENIKNIIRDMQEDYAELHRTIKGNGGGVQEGIEFKVIELQRIERECPGRNMDEFKQEMFAKFDEMSGKIDTKLDALENLALLKKGEKIGAQQERSKAKSEKKLLGEIVNEVLSSPAFRSSVITLVSCGVLTIGAWVGCAPKERRHPRPPAVTAIETPAPAPGEGARP